MKVITFKTMLIFLGILLMGFISFNMSLSTAEFVVIWGIWSLVIIQITQTLIK